MSMPAPGLVVLFLLSLGFTLATYLDPRSLNWGGHGNADNILKIVLGDGRRMFANHFFVKADAYFHSGYYPSIFDQAQKEAAGSKHIAEDQPEGREEEEHERAMNFLGQPRDWIDRFGRHFFPSTHSHLDQPGQAREILPWLRISADLDPQRVETYTVAAYWLRAHLGKPAEAEEFLREGLRANPTSFEILFELGKIYSENHHDPAHARNLWELALQRWQEQDTAKKDPDPLLYQEIVANLGHLEETQGDLTKALYYKQLEVKVSPVPDEIRKQIDELKQKLGLSPAERK